MEKKEYDKFYNRISSKILEYPQGVKYLNWINTLLTRVIYVIYPLFILYLFWNRDTRWIKVTVIPAIAFVLLSLVRKKINRPRPYETWNYKPLISKDTSGKSWPSRHVFSATVIAMAFFSIYPFMGIFFLIWSAVLAVIRVLGGVHYPSDVAAGMAIGIASGLIILVL